MLAGGNSFTQMVSLTREDGSPVHLSDSPKELDRFIGPPIQSQG